jgi:hypothetical protein
MLEVTCTIETASISEHSYFMILQTQYQLYCHLLFSVTDNDISRIYT